MSCCSCRARGASAEEAGAGSDSVVVAEGVVVEGLLLPVGVLGSATFLWGGEVVCGCGVKWCVGLSREDGGLGWDVGSLGPEIESHSPYADGACTNSNLCVGSYLDEHLAEVLALEKAHEGGRHLREAVVDRLEGLDLPALVGWCVCVREREVGSPYED